MGRKSIEKAGPDYHDEVTVTFRKNKEGFYKKIISIAQRERKSNAVKELGDEETEDLYTLVFDDDYDEKVAFEDFDGVEKFLKFKLVIQ